MSRMKNLLNWPYRLQVLLRILVAVVGGYCTAALSVAFFTYVFAGKNLATYSAMMFSFVVWLLVILWVFGIKSTTKACLGVVALMALLSAMLLMLGWRL